ncbi:MAG: hypothetical protein HY231_21815 [Acidobacteria bacterium]|nr:hypothetical protein [Acidobacteriota bacterium]
MKSLFDPTRSFQAIEPGRALELVPVILGYDPSDEQVDALIEIIVGITDERGDGARHTVATRLMRYIHAWRSDAWLCRASELQAGCKLSRSDRSST